MNKGLTQNLKQYLLIDWFQFTLFIDKNKYNAALGHTDYIYSDRYIPVLFYELFNINPHDILYEDTKINGYNRKYYYKSIEMYVSFDREDMGINIKLSGVGCRDLEELGINWKEFIKKLNSYDINYNRIDIAIDDFTNNYFTIEKLKKHIRTGHTVSKFKTSLEICKRALEEGTIIGNTLQFGSKASLLEITFYDKMLERHNQGYIVDNKITYWTRTELRFRHEYAKQVINELSNSNDIQFNYYIKSLLYNYIDFKSLKSNYKRKYEKETAQFWLDYLDNVNKLSLEILTPEKSIIKKKTYLYNNMSRTLATVIIADSETIGDGNIILSNFIDEMLVKGFKDITEKELQLINSYSKYKYTKQDIKSIFQNSLDLLHTRELENDNILE